MLSRYAAIRGMQVAQTAACNRLHDIEQRLSKRVGYIIALVKSKMMGDFREAEAADPILKLYILEGLAAI